MGKKILYFILGLLYVVIGYVGFILLIRAQLQFPYFVISTIILVFILPIILTVVLWKQKRMLAIGLIAGIVLLMPILQFLARPYEFVRDTEVGGYQVSYRFFPGTYCYYKSSLKRWFWVSN